MYFSGPDDSGGGRVRTRSQREGENGETGIRAHERRGGADGSHDRDRRRRNDHADDVGAGTGDDEDESHEDEFNDSSAQQASSFCPAIITPTRAPSALPPLSTFINPAVAPAATASCTTGDSFLGFGFDDPLEGGSGQSAESGGGRGRVRSSDDVDLGGGCDLGWGPLGAGDDMGRSLERAGSEEVEEGFASDREAEGRPSIVPEIDPHWSFQGTIGGQTRSARARSSSFYEGEDADMLACINGEAPARRTSSVCSAVGRYGSLAYSSSGSFSSSTDFDALLRPRSNSAGLTASQAGAAKSEAVAAAAAAATASGLGGAGDDVEVALTPATLGRRQLGKRELDALEAGLKALVHGARKCSSDDDRDLSSDSDPCSDDERDGDDYGKAGYYPEGKDEKGACSPRDSRGGECFFYSREGAPLSPISFNYRDGDSPVAGRPLSPPPPPPLQMELLGPLAFAGEEVVDRGALPRHSSDDGGGGGGGNGITASRSSGSLQALVGGHVLPLGVDPFLSTPASGGSDGEGVLSLSPRPVMMSSSLATETGTAAETAAFSLAGPVLLPPANPPALPRAASVAGDDGSDELELRGMGIPEPRHPPLVSWPPAEDHDQDHDEAGGAASASAQVAVSDPRAPLACDASGSPNSLGSPPAMLASLSLSTAGAPLSPRPRPSTINGVDSSPRFLVASPPVPPPSQLAPLPPPPPEPLAPSPPEPLAPPPPRPRTPDAPSSEAPLPAGGSQSGEVEAESAGLGSLSSSSSPLPFDDASGEDVCPGSRDRHFDGGGAGGGSPVGQVNPLMPPPPPLGLKRGSPSGSGGGSGGGGPGWRTSPGGSSCGSSGGSASSYKSRSLGFSNTWGSSSSPGGVSRLTGPGGPFRSNRPGASDSGSRARYRSGVGGGNGRSNVYGSAPGTLGDGSARREHGLPGSSTVQGFLSVGGGSRTFVGRRGHGGGQQAKKIKLLMLGDSGVGKSSLMERFTDDYFNVTKVQTLGVDFKLKTIFINEEVVDLQVWDTAGQQKFHKITRAYYRGSHGIVLVYDISDPQTLDNIAYWMRSIRDTPGSTRVQICLVGNKVDLRDEASQEGRQSGMVDTSVGRRVAEEFGAEYFECSAKTGCMVEEAFVATATKAFEAHLVKPSTPSSKSRRRLGRRKHHRNASTGSDRDRPPRGDASWSTPSASPLCGVTSESGADRLDNTNGTIRHYSSDASETSTSSVTSHTSTSASSPSHAVVTPSSPSFCASPSTMTGSVSARVTTPPSRSGPSRQQQQQQRATEYVQPQQQQQQQEKEHQQIREYFPPLSALSPKSAAAALGMGAGKQAGTEAGGEDSPTGTGTMSPLPGQQRSIGRASSLGEMEMYFGTATSPKGSEPDGSGSVDGGSGKKGGAAARRRADTGGGLFGLFGGGDGGGATGFGSSGSGSRMGSFSSSGSADGDGDGELGHQHHRARDGSGSRSPTVAEIIARQRQRSSPRATGAGGGGAWRDDPPPPAVSRMKGKKPPRIPRMKRMASGESPDRAGQRVKGGKNVCKVS